MQLTNLIGLKKKEKKRKEKKASGTVEALVAKAWKFSFVLSDIKGVFGRGVWVILFEYFWYTYG